MNKNTKDRIIKIGVELSRIILGCTFIFSGFVKAVDPMGTDYKIEDYLSTFGFSDLSFLALPASFLLCGFEFVLGAFMLMGIYRKINSRFMLFTMCFMTALTLYLAIANPVEDCGCFGDALKITNWQTFYKNIVLLLLSLVTFRYHQHITNFFTGKTYWLAALFIVAFIGLFMLRNYYFDPIFDFRPYKIGANIPQLMTVPEGKGRVEEMSLVYSKDGKEKAFTEQNYPWQDSTWTFVRLDTKVIREGELPKIKDFELNELLIDNDKNMIVGEEDVTQKVLTDTGYVFLMITPSLSEIRKDHLSEFEDIANYASDYNYAFYCLTASVSDDILAWRNEEVVDYVFCRADERALKTVIRTNPGLLLLKGGVVYNKWSDISVPSESELNAPLEKLSLGKPVDREEKDMYNLIYISAIFVLPLLCLKGLDFLFFWRKRHKAEPNKTS